MKSLMQLVRLVLQDLGDLCGTSTDRDLKTITARFEHEGMSFLTISLPAFASDFQKSLNLGRVADDHFDGFHRNGGFPSLFSGFLQLVFDRSTGRLLDGPSSDAIFAVRQACLLFSKILLPCSDARIRRSLEGYIECEEQVRTNDKSLGDAAIAAFRKMSLKLWGDVFQRVDENVYNGEIVPKHGPGATADKLKGNLKFVQREWTERLEQVFPHGEFLFPNWRHYDRSVDLLEPGAERPVRVITVPKTLKTPRIIAVEPTCMQYVQQGIAEKLLESIERDDILSKIVGFDDQLPNQQMAREGSFFGNLATLDLSEASDRVSNQLVRAMFATFPNLAEGVDACRSRKADVPGHGVIRLAKFASMGSALCFPIEAIVFTTVVFLGIQKALRRPLSRRDFKSFIGRVRIYGDDIIVPADTVHHVVSELETFGFRVNAGKSFWDGKFRESCGKEFYNGVDVSVTRVRRELPTQRGHAQELISAVSLRNQLYFAGLWKTVEWLDELIGSLIRFPVVLPSSPVLGRHSFLGFETQRVCPDLHRPLVRGEVVSAVLPESNLEGVGALLKVFLKRGDMPFADRRHLERAGRPSSVRTKTRWASAV